MKIETNADFLEVQKKFEAAGFPCDSPLAEELWNWSNDNNTCVALVYSAFKVLGYRAFAGFPLVRLSQQ